MSPPTTRSPCHLHFLKVARKYHNGIKSANAPHIYAIADQAFHNMKKSGKNQCAVVRYVRAHCWPISVAACRGNTHMKSGTFTVRSAAVVIPIADSFVRAHAHVPAGFLHTHL